MMKNPMIKFALLVAGITLCAVSVVYIITRPSTTVLSGRLDLNGSIPSGSTVNVLVRKDSSSAFTPVQTDVAAVNGARWSWSGAETGTSYAVKAELYTSGVQKGVSSEAYVTAPAHRIDLTINSTYAPPNPSPQLVTISGVIDLNGAVGANSFISLFQKKPSEENFTLVTNTIPATDGAAWSWTGAQEGQAYELMAALTVNDAGAGQSSTITVTAPATDEAIRINSTYQAPPQQVSITGTVVLNGQINPQSTVTILARGPGLPNFTPVVTGLSPSSGVVQWTWTNAVQGYSYQLQATVVLNGSTIANSQTITATAPATNEVLVVNLGSSGNNTVGQPATSPTIQCVSQNNGQWSVNINMQAVGNAQSYWLQVGTQDHGNNVVNTSIQASGQNFVTYSLNNVNNGQNYFAQYAASSCAGCTNLSQFSPFSNSTQFSCSTVPPSPTPTTATPLPTYTPYPTYTPAPSPTTAPSATPMVSACGQSCGGNGYSCAVGLSCSPGAIPGLSVCVNTDCPTDFDCNCMTK